MTANALASFTHPVRAWFASAFDAPTPIQAQAWESIRKGKDTLVIAPTGSGKTFAAFLSAIDELTMQKMQHASLHQSDDPGDAPTNAPARKGVRILYVSPLKALGADIERNLQAPLRAIAEHCQGQQESGSVSQITVGIRTGDTPQAERARLVRNPPDILITTPESLYLMLTSRARETLATVETVIVDELHSLAATKRGAHFSLSLERLDAILEKPAQRIGLSATIEPVETAAAFLGGTHPVNVIRDASPPAFNLEVVVPVADMTHIQPFTGSSGYTGMHPGKPSSFRDAWKTDASLKQHLRTASLRALPDGAPDTPNASHASDGADEDEERISATPDTRMGSATIWPYIEASVLDQVLTHSSTIVFVNSRGICERLTAQLNAAYDRRCGRTQSPSLGTDAGASMRSEIGSTTLLSAESTDPIAKAHHGSVSKERRHEIERELKSGQLRCVVATSSLELGIDMGEVDLVIQVAAPPSVSSSLQRIGRADHRICGTSHGLIYPRTRTELLDAAFIVEGMLDGAIEQTQLIEGALDVLAQQTAAEVAMHPDGIEPGTWLAIVRKSACYRNLPQAAFDAVIDMLADSFATDGGPDIAPRIGFDRVTNSLTPLPRTQKLAIGSAGTIPDRGLYPVMLNTGSQQKGRARVGELDEEMVHESRIGDVIILGTSTWRITQITNDRVLVAPAPGRTARLPFWHGEGRGRSLDAGLRRGALQARLDAETDGAGAIKSALRSKLQRQGFDESGIANLGALVAAQRASTHALPTDERIILELCPDDTGAWYLIVHAPFGKRVNEPWALAISQRVSAELGFDPECAAADEGIVMRLSTEDEGAINAALITFAPDDITRIVSDAVTETSLFAARFRECAARALLMRPSTPGTRTPLWQQRLRGGQLLEAARREPDFPIYLEAIRECLNDVYDLHGLCWLMEQIEAGAVTLELTQTTRPSPFASPLLFGYVADHLYEGDMPRAERSRALLSVDSGLLAELLGTPDQLALLDPRAVADVQLEAQRLMDGRKLSGAEGAAELLRQMGPLSAEVLAARLLDGASAQELLDELEAQHRACPILTGERTLWGIPEDAVHMEALTKARIPSWTEAWAKAESQGGASIGSALALKHLRTHALSDASLLADHLGCGVAIAEAALAHLAEQGNVQPLHPSTEARAILNAANALIEEADASAPLLPVGPAMWATTEMLRRLRLRSRDALAQETQPTEPASLERLVLMLQRIGGSDAPSTLDDAAECITLFEGIRFTASAWEQTVLPARVPGYRPALLDELLDAEEVIWEASAHEGKEPLIALYPADSIFAPRAMSPETQSIAEVTEVPEHAPAMAPHPLEAELRALLARNGACTLATIVQLLQASSADEAVSVHAITQALTSLIAKGAITSTSFASLRNHAAAHKAAPAQSARRISSRRSARARASAAARSALRQDLAAGRREQEALAGRWRATVPSDASPTERAIAQVETLLDLYGIVCQKTIEAAGFKGGMQAIYAVLRGMEDAGEVIRGEFVEGLGASQFARRHIIEALREEAKAGSADPIVLSATDPAMLYGSILPWPEPEAALIPANRSGCLVVLEGGAPLLFATKRLQHLIAFTSDEGRLETALRALVAHVQDPAFIKRMDAKEKLIVQKANGEDVYGTQMQEALSNLGFARDTHGMRLFLHPF